MLFGAHISSVGGVDHAPINAAVIGCEVFQFFSRSPQGGPAPVLTPMVIKDFQSAMKKNQQVECYIHTPYYINLASVKNSIHYSSIKTIREELERASLLGVKYVMTHLGSANDLPRNEALKKVTEGIKKILEDYRGDARLLIENSAGAGNIIGDQFEEIQQIIRQSKQKLGVCLDTCHAFALGYDLRHKKSLDETLKKFDKVIGLEKLKLIHANDSKTELGSRKDRHEHIGLGYIGAEGFKAIVNHPKLKNINLILETPVDERGDQADDLRIIKKLRK